MTPKLDTVVRKHGPGLILLALEVSLLVGVVVPFVLHNNLLRHDMVGHLAAAQFTHDYLFPRISGFNPFFYCGTPQNQLYPPLLAYVTAGIGQILDVSLALKLVVAAGVLATIPSAWWCARAHGLSPWSSAMATLAISMYLATERAEIGGTFFSTFVVGNLANALALPLFFAYAAALAGVRKAIPGSIVLPASLLAASLITHLVGGIVAGVLLLIHMLLACIERLSLRTRLRRLFLLSAQGALALAASAFFLVPLLAYQRFGSRDNHSYNQYPDSLLWLVVVGAVLVAWYIQASRHADEGCANENGSVPIGGPIAPLALLSAFVLWARNFVFNDYFPHGVGLHVHRFRLYDAALLPMLLVWLVVENSRVRAVLCRTPAVACALLIGLVVFGRGLRGLEPGGVPDQPTPALQSLSSRVMVLGSPTSQVSDHALQHLVPLRTRALSVKGLFIEAAANARYLLDLERMLAADAMSVRTWGIDLDSQEALERVRPALPELLSAFGIGYVVSREPVRPFPGLVTIGDAGNGFTVYRTADTGLAEVWRHPIGVVPHHAFSAAADRWFFGDSRQLMVALEEGQTYDAGHHPEALAHANVMAVAIDAANQKVVIDVAADEPVPVLVKVSYFPNWVARDFFGHDLPFYRVTPGLVLVIGRGRIVLSYERTKLEERSARLSMLGALVWIGLAGAAGLAALTSRAHRWRAM